MTTYERVTYRPADGRAVTVVLENPVETGEWLIGRQVDKYGDEVRPSLAYLRASNADDGVITHVIERSVITRRVPLEMDLRYGELVPRGTATDV